MFDVARRAVRAAFFLTIASLAACDSPYHGTDLFPLYRDTGDAKAGEFFQPLPPYWHSWSDDGKESLSWSFPFHLHRQKGEFDELTLVPLIPIYFHQKTFDSETKSIFPIWQQDSMGVRETTKLLLFVVGWTANSDEPGLQGLTVCPFFSWMNNPSGRSWDAVTTGDFFTGKPGAGALFSLLAVDHSRPYIGEKDAEGTDIDVFNVLGGFVQLFHTGDSGSHDETRFLSLFGSEPLSLVRHRSPHPGGYGKDNSVTTVFPFYFDIQDSDGGLFEIWPIYGKRTRGETVTDRHFVWPLLTTSNDDVEHRHGFSCLLGLFGSLEENEIANRWLFPLFFVKTSDRGHDWRILYGFLGHAANESKRVTYVLWIPFESDDSAKDDAAAKSEAK